MNQRSSLEEGLTPTTAMIPASTVRVRRRVVAEGWRRRLLELRHDWPLHIVLILALLVAFAPLGLMVIISFKNMGQFFASPLSITFPLELENYVIAFNVLKRSILNSTFMAAIVIVLSIGIAALSAYVFAMFQFPGRDFLFWLYLSVMFVPGILTLTTRYILVQRLGILDTYWVQILPYVATAQVFQTVIMRSFFAGLPKEVIEAAKVDGAGVLRIFWQIVLPMSRPILAALAVMRAIGFWDEWLWPMITVFDWEIRPVALQVFYLQGNVGGHVGYQMAGYVISSLPLVLLFALASKQFVRGLTSGAIRI